MMSKFLLIGYFDAARKANAVRLGSQPSARSNLAVLVLVLGAGEFVSNAANLSRSRSAQCIYVAVGHSCLLL